MTKKLYEELEAGELMWMQWAQSQSTASNPADKISNPADKTTKAKRVISQVSKPKVGINVARKNVKR